MAFSAIAHFPGSIGFLQQQQKNPPNANVYCPAVNVGTNKELLMSSLKSN